ncbi:MAG: MBL fold metallo-hydrolase [Acidimicrobiales bacterium]|nr:MBL fold metallo-hydrolase [Acidimicrobiales bacterium]
MAVKLTVLGCSGSFPGPGAACSGYLVQSPHATIVVDLGSGTLANLQRHIDLADLDAIVLSHAHPDHWVDLAGLDVAYRYAQGREAVPVYGTAGTRQRAEHLLGHLKPTFAWQDLDDTSHISIGDLTLDFSATDHYVETFAVLMTADGVRLAYSADTGPGWSFAEFGVPIDLALCEATFLAEREGEGILHLSARQAGSMARDAGVDRLVLTHLEPRTDPARSRAEGSAAFGREVSVAAEHAVFVV